MEQKSSFFRQRKQKRNLKIFFTRAEIEGDG